MLTIAIPTFDRNQLLEQCVARVLPQLAEGERLLIVDNRSRIPVHVTLAPLLAGARPGQVQVVRNAVNIGGAANILRCLELCETDWMYCLGDDDLIADDCLSAIREAVGSHPDALYFSFSRSIHKRSACTRSEGAVDFVDKLDHWSSFLFMSCVVVAAQKLRQNIRFGYLYAYSWAPLQAILFRMLNDGGAVVFSDRVLCREESLTEETWVPFAVAAGKMILPELINDRGARRRLAYKLMGQPSITSLIYWGRVKGDMPNVDSRLFVGLYLSRCERYAGWMRMLPYRLLAFVLLHPRLLPPWLFERIQSLAFKALGRAVPTSRPMSQDRT